MDLGIKGRKAIVCASSKGLGKATAMSLAREGVDLVISARGKETLDATAEEIRRATGAKVIAVAADVTTPEGRVALLAVCPKPDILVTNAGGPPPGDFRNWTRDDWLKALDANMLTPIELIKATVDHMIGQKWGRIVNFVGMNAIHGYAGRAHVSVAKHGVWGLTKALGKEFGPQGITTNVVSPGPIAGERDDAASARHILEMVGRVPVGRLGRPEEVAAAVSLLASERGAFINGQMIQVNGGAET